MSLPDNATGYSSEWRKTDASRIFGRSDVMGVIDIKLSRASDLLKDMAERGIIEPVSGHGKGKYGTGSKHVRVKMMRIPMHSPQG